MSIPKSARHVNETVQTIKACFARHHHGSGLVLLIFCLLGITFLANVNFQHRSKMFMAGEIASQDVIADNDLYIVDQAATQARRDQFVLSQPMIFDLTTEPVTTLREDVFGLFNDLNALDDNSLDAFRQKRSEALSTEIAAESIQQWARPEVQQFVVKHVLPWLEPYLVDGVVTDARLIRPAKGGAIIRNLENGSETLRTEISAIPDINSLLAGLSQMVKSESTLAAQGRRAVTTLIAPPLLLPTLTFNREATQSRALALANALDPVTYRVYKGELVVRHGERVSHEQQEKLQSLFHKTSDRVDIKGWLGSFLLCLVLSIGIFIAPSGKLGTPLRRQDLYFISLLLLIFAVLAKGYYLLLLRLADPAGVAILAYGYPIAGIAGLSAFVFSARRYSTSGLLNAFCCTLMLEGNIEMFLFFFLSAMFNTFLVNFTQNRQDVVRSLVPLIFIQQLLWLGAALFMQLGLSDYLDGVLIVTLGSVLSLLILFALSPIVELVFGYTTRFRLMELMNLEQPLLQELMVNMPGTYHHSLLVANMVEAGAKTIGANSMLCKVAALYHDLGKLPHPDYYIENQFGNANKHDRLAPSMSALILISHVKKGEELADEHKLGHEISDIIRQHHGTRIIRYFYQKAVDLGDNPHREDYCYPGPRPQTREAAIIMLADAVEASSRTLSDPTPARIKNHIDTIIKGIFSEGQLDESELTFKDLSKLSESFQRILTGLFHQRIAYPDVKGKEKSELKDEAPTPESPVSATNSKPEKNIVDAVENIHERR